MAQITTEALFSTFNIFIAWKASLPVIAVSDLLDPYSIIQASANEVDEAVEEAEGPEDLETATREAIELLDTVVLYLSALSTTGYAVDIEDLVRHPVALNGAGSKSSFYDKGKEVILNTNLRDPRQDSLHYLGMIISKWRHSFDRYNLDLVQIGQGVIEKNRANRPQRYYQATEHGRALSLPQLLKRYVHNERMLRYLRTHYGSPLEPTWHELFADLIVDFTQPERNFSELQRQVAIIDKMIGELLLYGQLRTTEALKNTEPALAQKAEASYNRLSVATQVIIFQRMGGVNVQA